jgi:hypothetical protein
MQIFETLSSSERKYAHRDTDTFKALMKYDAEIGSGKAI